MYILYALIDPRNQQVRYVGMTNDVYDRLRQHLYSRDNPAKDAWIQELRDANIMVVMQELQRVEGVEQAKRREAYWIQHYHQLGAHLTNHIIPLEHEIVYVRTEEMKKEKELRLGPRMSLGEQRAYITKLWVEGISRQTIYSMVGKFIHRDYVTVVLADYERQQPLLEVQEAPSIAGPLLGAIPDLAGSVQLTQAQKMKLLQVLECDAQQMGQNEIIRKVWGVEPNTRQGGAAAEELRVIRAYIAEHQRKTIFLNDGGHSF